jgi:phage N-6-adenine-methyltransferase
MRSSATAEWSTPDGLFAEIAAEFGPFDLDPCATAENAKAPEFYTELDDGLTFPWKGRVFMNPPYGTKIRRWMRKAYESSLDGALVVCLVPARTDTRWFHEYAMKGEVRFLRGRVKFGGATENAPFPSAIVVFRPGGAR